MRPMLGSGYGVRAFAWAIQWRALEAAARHRARRPKTDSSLSGEGQAGRTTLWIEDSPS
ncbi:hypothetical protein RKD23_002992 [Streptomyces sp. SAI-170]